MKALVIGAGKMGSALVWDLASNPDVQAITVADRDLALAREVAERMGRGRASAAALDAGDAAAVRKLMAGQTVAVGAADYRFNELLTREAIAAGVHFCDLGGNNTVVERQFAMNAAAREAGVTVVPDCGLAPGMVSLLVAHGVERLERPVRAAIRVGGLPVDPQGPLRYQIVFSVRGLTNEYREPAQVLRDGRLLTVPSLTELEELDFPAPFGRLEAFQTSGGLSTLARTYGGRLRDLDYKTIRYPGHCSIMKALFDLGFLDEEPVRAGTAELPPRTLTEALLTKNVPSRGPDVVLVRVTVEGELDGRAVRLGYQCIEYSDSASGNSAMGRMTAYPASIIAQMMGCGAVTLRGVHPQEVAVPPGPFLEALGRRDIRVEQWEEALA